MITKNNERIINKTEEVDDIMKLFDNLKGFNVKKRKLANALDERENYLEMPNKLYIFIRK